MLKFNTLIISILILTSCTVISVIPVGGSSSGVYQDKIPVYTSRATFDSEYEEIAIITAKYDAEFGVASDEETMDKILKKAQLVGADAVILEESDSQSLRVTAIKFKKQYRLKILLMGIYSVAYPSEYHFMWSIQVNPKPK